MARTKRQAAEQRKCQIKAARHAYATWRDINVAFVSEEFICASAIRLRFWYRMAKRISSLKLCSKRFVCDSLPDDIIKRNKYMVSFT